MASRARRRPIPEAVPLVGSAFLGLLLLAPAHAWPQDGEVGRRSAATEREGKRAVSTALEGDERVEVDGRLDEELWPRARWLDDFRQKEPRQGAEPSVRTEVAFVHTDEALYVGARLETEDPEGAVGFVTRRDEPGEAERLVVSLDTFRDGLTSFGFAVTAAGARLDWLHPADREEITDFTFDAVWEAATTATLDGWTAELRIPFSQLRFDEGGGPWGLNVSRFVPSRNEAIYWVLVAREQTGWASRFGILEGWEDLPRRRPAELRPFGVFETRIRSASLVAPADPFTDRVETHFRAGADLKFGLSSNFTLDATISPDFGQVDFDPAVVNLSAFETVFAERRPFFTEGNSLLTGGSGPRLYFSRRIGAEPHGRPRAAFVDAPEATTILGAGKVTGRLPSGLSVGVLAAVTAEETASTVDTVPDSLQTVPVEPATGRVVLRLQQEFGASGSTAGWTGTAVVRDLEPDSDLAALLPRRAFAAKGDWNLRFRGGAWELAGHTGFSVVEGDTAALERLQRSSAHFFQRPDQRHVRLDPTRTSLGGWTAGLRVSKNAGRWLLDGGVQASAPGLELNDAGQLFRGDDLVAWSGLTLRETEPGPLFRSWTLTARTRLGWNFGGVRRAGDLALEAGATLSDFTRATLVLSWIPSTLSDDLTRGGPLMRRPDDWTVSAALESDPSSALSWRASIFRGNRNFTPDWIVRTRVALDPAARWRLSLEPRYLHLEDGRQYVTTVADGPAATFGSRYVFANARVREIAIPMRAAYAFTPDLSLDATAEPFAASGNFTRFGELVAPSSSDLRRYERPGADVTEIRTPDGGRRLVVVEGGTRFEVPDPDFRRLSFRTNVVLRWEWRPGSTVLLVWRGRRSLDRASDDFVGPATLGETVANPGVDTFTLKISHWLPIS